MKIEPTEISNVFIITPEVHEDERGTVFETFRKDTFFAAGIDFSPTQCHSVYSKKRNTVRGLNFQLDPPMDKYTRVSRGSAFLVAVDIRKDSPTVGKWVSIVADDKNHIGLYAPAGFARGIQTLTDDTIVEYISSGLHAGGTEKSIRFDDPDIAIKWSITEPPIVSQRAVGAPSFKEWLALSTRLAGTQ